MLLTDFLRHTLGLTGTHVGCEHGVCGACTIQIDGAPARACLTLAVQADGAALRTIEGLAPEPGRLSVLQQAFRRHHALQCGFCTAGILMSLDWYLRDTPDPSETELREFLGRSLARHKLPDELALVEGIPRTVIGKVDRPALVATVLADEPARQRLRPR